MTEISINAISPTRAAESPDVLARAPAPVETETPSAPVPKQQEPTKTQAPKQMESASAAMVSNSSKVSLQFRIDEKTKDVTVFVVDRNSKRVLRSIPASELAKLQAGDLLKLTA
jgi:uncharacterized FlaG/YvyC family protein